MIDVTASKRRECDLLTKAGQCAQIPSCRGKGALRILAFGAGDSQAIGLQLNFAAKHWIVDPQAVIDFRKRDGRQSLTVAGAQRLHRPPGEREIAVIAKAFNREC